MKTAARENRVMRDTNESFEQTGIRHGFFTRLGGVSKGLYASLNCGLGSNDAREDVVENRRRVAEELGTEPQRLLTLYQTHSADTKTVHGPWPDTPPKADAMVTNTPGVALGVLAADCAPVLFADAENGVIGAAHAGWKGAFSGILESALGAMEALGARRSAIHAVIGPTISQKAYEVGPEFMLRFYEADGNNARFFGPSKNPGHAHFDLPAYISDRLILAGVQHIADCAMCTYEHPERYFSYRRSVHREEPDYGRQISAIMIEA